MKLSVCFLTIIAVCWVIEAKVYINPNIYLGLKRPSQAAKKPDTEKPLAVGQIMQLFSDQTGKVF